MALRVIGAGFGRTGTESLKAALEQLGFGPCDHMFELIKSTWRVKHLEALERGDTRGIEELFRNFGSAVDFPYAKYYRELMVAYPNAKVVLTVRDPDAWYDSARKTILRGIPPGVLPATKLLGLVSRNAHWFGRWHAYITSAIMEGMFQGRMKDRAFMKDVFARWNEEVKNTVPPERLLVYEVRDGWEPLCAFLGVAVPSTPFPRANDIKSFEDRTRLRNMARTLLKRS